MSLRSVLIAIIVTGTLFACAREKLSESDIEELFALATVSADEIPHFAFLRASALASVAETRVALGHSDAATAAFVEAKTLARSFTGDDALYWNGMQLARIASLEVTAGFETEGRETVHEALALLTQLPSASRQGTIFIELAETMARIGDRAIAQELANAAASSAENVFDLTAQSRVYHQVAGVYQLLDARDAMRSALDKAEPGAWLADDASQPLALMWLATTQAKLGYRDAALEIQNVLPANYHSAIEAALVENSLDHGEIEQAKSDAQTIADPAWQARAYMAIARHLVSHDADPEAEEMLVAARMSIGREPEAWKTIDYYRIADLQLQSNDAEGATKTLMEAIDLNRDNNSNWNWDELADVIVDLADTGHVDAALILAQSIHDSDSSARTIAMVRVVEAAHNAREMRYGRAREVADTIRFPAIRVDAYLGIIRAAQES